jgi:predicted ATP-grasp superfamily ATP-dependent carboligase
LGCIRALATQGVPVILLDHENTEGKLSRYVHRFYRCPSALEPERLMNFMMDLGESRDLKGWVVFPTDDETVHFLSTHKPQLESIYKITTPPWNVTRYAYDKTLTYRLAEKIGVPTPKTFYPRNARDLEDRRIPFPAIIKPAVMRSFFRQTGKKVFLAGDREELVDAYRRACQIIPASEVLVQELIPDVSRNLFSFSPFFKNGRVLGRVIVQRIRQHPMDFGRATTYALTVDAPELERLGVKVLTAMNYYGIGEVEFIRDPRDGRFKFLEVNPRIWGWHTIALRAGVNLPYLLYLDQTGTTRTIPGYRKDVKWIREITDFTTVVSEISKGRMRIGQVLKSWKGEKELAVFSWKDPLPFFGEFLRLPTLWKQGGF